MANWNTSNIPNQTGRTALITGGNAGIGYEVARVLARRGAEVILASRNVDKTAAAATHITTETPGAKVGVVELDLGNLESVHAAAKRVADEHATLDLLINNAGVSKHAGVTEDGFEAQLGINHLGAFALTGLLVDLLLPARGSRVVTVSSVVHRTARLDPTNLATTGDDNMNYARSKLANLLFTFELARRFEQSGSHTLALAAHPGVASTDMSRKEVPAAADRFVNSVLGRTALRGAFPTLRAATDPAAENGAFYGPGGFLGVFGYPSVVKAGGLAHSEDLQGRLWAVSEELTQVHYRLIRRGESD